MLLLQLLIPGTKKLSGEITLRELIFPDFVEFSSRSRASKIDTLV